MSEARDRFHGCLLGLAAGDAVGTTLEFAEPGTFEPIDDMIGGGPFGLRPGEWTDDTSMALCLATSLVHCSGFDARDQMRRYSNWQQLGYLSSNGRCFDIGHTVSRALERFRASGDPIAGPTEPSAAGNGSLMRLAPVPMFFFPDPERAIHFARESSRTTHGATECLESCELMAELLLRALAGATRQEILRAVSRDFSTPALRALATLGFFDRPRATIRASGYVVHSLEAALWCFARTTTFRDAVLLAANLGEDADTTAAICGQLAGAHYGAAAIPAPWRERLVMADEIRALADALHRAAN